MVFQICFYFSENIIIFLQLFKIIMIKETEEKRGKSKIKLLRLSIYLLIKKLSQMQTKKNNLKIYVIFEKNSNNYCNI